MTGLFAYRTRRARDAAHKDWIDARRREARIVVADVVHHSDPLLRLACQTLIRHGETPEEREDARLLLLVLEAKDFRRGGGHEPDPEGAR